MEHFEIKPQGVCAKAIHFDIEDGKIHHLNFIGGCPGNAIGLARLIEGKAAAEVSECLIGTTCGRKATSCPDQLALALKEVLGHGGN